MSTGLRVFKIHLGSIGNVAGLTSPEEAAVATHGGDPETSAVRAPAPDLGQMDRADGYLYSAEGDVGYSFKGQDAIEAWVSADLSQTGAIGNPHPSAPEKGKTAVEAKIARLAQLLEAIYRQPKREIFVAPTGVEATV
jgi:creatinine amidohydrolase/Fe(II)-dependent formamide hydrolase-like protein